VFIANDIAELFDLVILAVKAYALDQALADLAPAVGAGTMIMPLLNRMRHIDLLIQRFGEAPVLGGVCFVATTIDEQGRIIQLADTQELTYGERNGAMTERLRALDAVMQGAGFNARLRIYQNRVLAG
jgi:2-dehydropantoate 2-reductase